MIQRNANGTRDWGGGPVGSPRGPYHRTIGAVTLQFAVPPKITSWTAYLENSRNAKGRRDKPQVALTGRAESQRRYWAGMTDEERQERADRISAGVRRAR